MSRSRVLVLARSADVRAVKAALADSQDRRFIVESTSRC